MYQTIILDLDNTLIDFDQMEIGSLKESFLQLNIEYTEEMIEDYITINHKLWAGLENGKYDKAFILINRFDQLFDKYNIKIEATEMNLAYLNNMANHIYMFEGAEELMKKLKSRTLICMTNGVKLAQDQKLERSGLGAYFDHIIISDEVGYHKPDIKIFDHLETLVKIDKDETIIVGDSLNSDIQGGINYGIDTVWFNPKGKHTTTIEATYEIKHLLELDEILSL